MLVLVRGWGVDEKKKASQERAVKQASGRKFCNRRPLRHCYIVRAGPRTRRSRSSEHVVGPKPNDVSAHFSRQLYQVSQAQYRPAKILKDHNWHEFHNRLSTTTPLLPFDSNPPTNQRNFQTVGTESFLARSPPHPVHHSKSPLFPHRQRPLDLPDCNRTTQTNQEPSRQNDTDLHSRQRNY